MCKNCLKLIFAALFLLSIQVKVFAISHDELTMNGIASNWVLNNELYAGSLYLENIESSPTAIFEASGRKRMEFRITTDKWRQRNFKKTWSRSISINIDADTQKKFSKDIIRFSGMLKGPLLYGDKVTIDYTPRKHTKIFINGVMVFYTSKSAFFNVILSAWIGARPPSTDFKKQILKLDRTNMETQDVLSRYDYIRPDLENQRKKEIQSWVAKPKVKPAPAPAPAPAPKPTVQSAPAPKPTVQSTPAPKPTVQSTPAPKPTVQSAPAPKPTVQSAPAPTATQTPSAKTKPSKSSSGGAFDSLLDEIENNG